MHAIRQHEHGGADVLRWEEVPDPIPGPGEVRIRVEVAGVHRIDTAIRAGHVDGSPDALPATPGREVAGTVDALGPGADESWLGTRVAAHLGHASGGCAELAVAPVAALHALPPLLDAASAVTAIGTGRTAQAVLDRVPMDSADAVLVLAASGGLGHLLLQSARDRAAVALGTAGGKAKAARLHPMRVPIVDHLDPRWSDVVRQTLAGRDLTIVLDTVGGAIGRAAFELLAPAGRHVLVGAAAGAPVPIDVPELVQRGISLVPGFLPTLAADRRRLRTYEERALSTMAAGDWRPLVTAFPLHEAAAAHRAIESRSAVGKVVLERHGRPGPVRVHARPERRGGA